MEIVYKQIVKNLRPLTKTPNIAASPLLLAEKTKKFQSILQ